MGTRIMLVEPALIYQGLRERVRAVWPVKPAPDDIQLLGARMVDGKLELCFGSAEWTGNAEEWVPIFRTALNEYEVSRPLFPTEEGT